MQKIVNCKLVITSKINGKSEDTVIEGKGYYKKEKEQIVYFTSSDIRYKYEINDNKLKIYCNDSWYEFIDNQFSYGEIKNGDYIFKITTFTNKLEINDNYILLNYELSQNKVLIGQYFTELSFN